MNSLALNSLALRSLAHRRSALTATFVNALLGAAMIGSFATVGVAATGPVSTTDEKTLLVLSVVVGSIGALVVLFAVLSASGITVRQRLEEIALLRTVGASSRQVRSLVRREAGWVLGVGSLAGAVVAMFAGHGLLALVQRLNLVSDDVSLGDAIAAPVSLYAAPLIAAVVVTAAGTIGAGVAARRASRDPALHSLAASRSDEQRIRAWRWILAIVCFGHAASMSVITVVDAARSTDPYDAMSTSGSNSIVVAVGLALIAPAVLRLTVRVLARVVGQDAAGHLAAFNAARRAPTLAAVLGPVMVLTAAAVGTANLIGIDSRTGPAHVSDDAKSVNLLNHVVVGMLVLFAAVAVLNAFAAATAARRTEFARLLVIGADRATLRSSVTREAWLIAAAGVVFGVLASLATSVPFGLARHEGVVPDGQRWLPVAIGAGVVVLTLTAARTSLARVELRPAVR